jgi:DNA-binding CsgD family transcriptional regulator
MTDVVAITLDDLSINLPVVRYQDQPVVTTELLAKLFGTEQATIRKNFSRNEERFELGKHFFTLEGEELKDFKELHCVTNSHTVKIALQTRVLTLWTKRGAARHSKMLGTDQAWDMFDQLEEAYFSPAVQADAGAERLKHELLRRVSRWGNIYRWRSGGVTVVECARLLGCSETTVRADLAEMARLDIVPPEPALILGPRPVTKAEVSEWMDRYINQGHAIAQIARDADRAESTVWDAIQRATRTDINQLDIFATPGVMA